MPVFLIKEIQHFSRRVGIVLQNANGPCALLAIVNVLLLENRMSIPPASSAAGFIEDQVLLECVANALMDVKGTGSSESEEHVALNEVLDRLGQLLEGMDLNIRFVAPSLFESTPAIIFFDMLGVKLFHAWVCDPSKREEYNALNSLSYNEALNKLVEESGDERDDENRVIRNFLENDSAGQFTFYGLVKLMEVVPERSLTVLYRNNHFSTMFRNGGQLYTLVSDTGYTDSPMVAWETLDYEALTGNSSYVPPFISPSPPAPTPNALPIVFDVPGEEGNRRTNNRVDRRFFRSTPEGHSARPSCVLS